MNFREIGLFAFLAGGIYSCYLTSAIFHEKLLKQPYKHFQTGEEVYCKEALLFCIFPALAAACIGGLYQLFQSETKQLPISKSLICGAIINSNVLTYNMAVVEASFPAIVMAKSCSLLSVIIVGVFCSKVKDSALKLSYKNLLIGVIATIGIIFFNFFKKQEKTNEDKPLQLFSLGTLYLLISWVGDGFLPDFQAQIKSQYKPTSMEMYFNINRYTAVLGLLIAFFTNRLPYILHFLFEYQSFAYDVCALSVLNAVGQLFIYRMITEFRQHIPAFVIAFRKCLTVLINIVWFHHLINWQQMIGIGFVFVAVMWEVYENQKNKKEGHGDGYHMKINENDNEMVEIEPKDYDEHGILDAIDKELGDKDERDGVV